MTTSVIVLHYGSRQLTDQCLESLAAYSPEAEVVVVDNAPPNTNLGFAAGCNQGARQAHGSMLVFLNNDTRVREGWLEPLDVELGDPTTGAAGPVLLYPDDRVQCAGVGIDWARPLADEAWNLQAMPEHPRTVVAITGACLAIRRSVFDEVGGFDEGYWNGYEDVDLCLKLNDAGYRCRVTPHSRVVHYESQSNPEERFRRVRENVVRLRERWDPTWRIATSPT